MKVVHPDKPCFTCGKPEVVYNDDDKCPECQAVIAQQMEGIMKRGFHLRQGYAPLLGGGAMRRNWC